VVKKNFWEQVELYPPALVRLMARRREGGKKAVVALTDEEIAIDSDLPLARVQDIYWMKNWDSIPFGEIRSFIQACRFDPTNAADRNRANAYVHQPGGPKYRYLQTSPLWKSTFKPLICYLKN